jgi:hypothetical protein
LSQIIATKNALSNPACRLSLNIPTIQQLLPSLDPGDLTVLHGGASVSYIASLLCVKAQLPMQIGGLASKAIFIDGREGNSFRLYQITKIAQLQGLNPTAVLKRIIIARAFTAYQMTSLIMDKLREAVEATAAKFVVVSDIANTFLDEKVRTDDEAQRIYSQVAAYLSKLAKKKQLIILATYMPHEQTPRNATLQKLIQNSANVVASIRTGQYHRYFVLEKHPRYALGSAEFPSGHTTLPEFFGGFD